ncbi:uncharacterized protein [Solanum tuberosum]|uniref:uncharacterized protein isoform X1 n=1 Tax=Solanum tuberosum TaxID=4113 RepID=UPI0003D28DE2|nr:PREDICTED: uncharacterized protein LOC102587641 isoform X1 [Solanum tuberosum]XP_006358309.1 PREDICTED: uncharacterized protein LOC102587641 isoform X1 [Solanum tuberosum]XP_006358310.1 PREDICTED: uncharacterized protein LOC102587641 isoform X1 [Solanum tuberosum]XP_006358311.1 PREDICTED: uncharacterized protein LOC102587641 isoform X1 [Solanum tuberosum]XP_015169369.1 PREDICTED: uncharacterized protein LOC102587641 isoform X1 [Solanum tuberosum]XP_015169370.1 PREDICTED: uncharacterized pro
MEKKILPSSSGGYDIDSCGMHLGQRISRPVDLPEFSWTPESRLKENGPLLFTTEENTRELTVNQSKSASVVALGDSFQHQSNYQNSVEGYTSSLKAQENEVKSINHYPLCTQQSTQHQHPLWKYDFPIGETPDSLNWVSQTNNMLAQADTGRSSSKSDNSYTGKSQIHPHQGYLISGNPDVTSRMPLEYNVSTGVVREFGAVEQISSQHHSSYASSHGRGYPEEANKFGNSCVLKQSLKYSNRSGSNIPCWWNRDILSRGSASTDQKAGGKSLHTKAQNSIGSFDNRVDTLESRGRSHMEGDMKKDLKAIAKENIKSSLTDDLSSKHVHSPSNCVQHVESNKSIHSSHRLNEKSRLPSNKMSPAAEKLWEGSLQLSSSFTVSVVAFFKSGEKLLDVKWSEFVVAKGRVRLDDFEKYIKNLPSSSSRALTVVSICLKKGASAIGLKGMKAVAKDYMKCGRVGIAKLSPGVTIYLCPPTNAIFIILEKYGFLKGTAAVEGNSQLMIGCVVWQKNRTALTSVLKKSEEKANSLQEQLQKSPSDSSMLQGGGQGSLSMPSVMNSNPSAPLSSFSNLEQANVTDNKSIGIDSASRTTLTASGVKSPPFQQKKSELSGSHLWGSKGHLSSSEASCVHQSNDEPPKESRNLPKPVTSLLSNASKRKMAFPDDDDDLPEYDFGTASGISSTSHRSYGSIIGNRLQLSGSRILDMSKQPTRPVAPSACMTIPRSVISISKEMPLARNVNDYSQLVTASRQMEGKHYSQSHAIPVTVPVRAYGSPMVPFHSSGKKNLLCDDDIPEWLPPDAQNERTNEPPKTFPPAYPTSRMLLPLPTGSVFPYPSSAPTHNSFSSQPSPLYHLPANSRVPPPMPSQKGPSNLIGFTFNPVPRPQSSSRAAASSLKPADKRVRRFRMLH